MKKEKGLRTWPLMGGVSWGKGRMGGVSNH